MAPQHPELGEKQPGTSNIREPYDEKDDYDHTAVPSPDNPSVASHHVDVEGAKADFEALRRSLSRASSLHRVASGQKSVEDAVDEEDFDLKEYMVRMGRASRSRFSLGRRATLNCMLV